MIKRIACSCLLFTGTFTFSQEGTFLHDFTGKPYMLTRYIKVTEGSAFFKEDFMMGTAIMYNGDEFKNQWRLNLLDNQLNYLDNRQQEMIATGSIKEISLFDTLTVRKYNFVYSDFLQGNSKPDRGWYERLSSGKTILLKQYKKALRETPLYGSASTELTITTQTRYYILFAGEWKWVKKLKNLADFLSDKKVELLKYIKDRQWHTEAEENFIALVDYYNSLH